MDRIGVKHFGKFAILPRRFDIYPSSSSSIFYLVDARIRLSSRFLYLRLRNVKRVYRKQLFNSREMEIKSFIA